MGNNTEKVKGKLDEMAGKVKRNVGDALDNEQMEAEGKTQELRGQGHYEAAKAAEGAKAAGEQLVGGAKDALGELTGNEQMEAEGEAERLKGEAREKANQ